MSELLDEISSKFVYLQQIPHSLFFGFSLGGGLLPVVFRSIVLLFLVCIHAVINRDKWGQSDFLIFAAVITFIVAIITITLTILNRLIDNSFELTSDSEESISDLEPPEGISNALWQLRNSYSFDEQRAGDSALDLIQLGFPIEEVFKLAEIMSTQTEPAKKQESSKNNQKAKSYIRLCGSIKEIPFNREQISTVFPFPKSFLYIIITSCLIFFQLYLVAFAAHQFPNYQYWWYIIVSGASIYSVLQPPEVEPYSLNHEEFVNGMTRPFVMIISCSFILLFEHMPKWLKPLDLEDFGIYIDWAVIAPHGIRIWKFAIFLLPLWVLFVVASIDTTIVWFIEAVNRYCFGSCGVAGLVDSFAQLIRCSIAYIFCYFMDAKTDFKYHDEVIIIVSWIILNIPLSPISLRKLWIYIIQLIILTGCVAIASIFVSSSQGYLISLIVIPVVFDLLLPFLTTYTQYLFLLLRLIRISFLHGEFFFVIVRVFFGAAFISYCVKHESIPSWLFSFFVIIVLNSCIGSTSIYSFSLLLFVHFVYERKWEKLVPAFIVAYVVGRKIMHSFDIAKEFIFGRMSGLSVDTDFPFSLNVFLSFPLALTPFLDREISFVSFIWSLLTGAPRLFLCTESELLFHDITLPLSPRPNVFWDLNPKRNLDVMKTISSHATDHPREATVYLSAVRSLLSVLAKHIYSGQFGAVDENDFFLLVSGSMDIILHIVSLRPNCVQFQIRGLEFAQSTYCHDHENRALNDLSTAANEWIIFPTSLEHLLVNWNLITDNFSLDQYQVYAIELPTVFNTSSIETVELWLRYSIIFSALKHMESLLTVPTNSNVTYTEEDEHVIATFAEALEIELSEDLIKQVMTLKNDVTTALTNNESTYDVLCQRIFNAFHNNLMIDDEMSWLSNNERVLTNIVTPAARLFMLSMVLEQYSLIGPPDLSEGSDTVMHFLTYEDLNLVAPASSPEFAQEFTRSEKSLVSLEICGGTRMLLFFNKGNTNWQVFRLNKHTVRSLWASQAHEQIFFNVQSTERGSIQYNNASLHNLVNQACNLPIGYPAYVSPVLSSYYTFV